MLQWRVIEINKIRVKNIYYSVYKYVWAKYVCLWSHMGRLSQWRVCCHVHVHAEQDVLRCVSANIPPLEAECIY